MTFQQATAVWTWRWGDGVPAFVMIWGADTWQDTLHPWNNDVTLHRPGNHQLGKTRAKNKEIIKPGIMIVYTLGYKKDTNKVFKVFIASKLSFNHL